ncbi:MAG: polysaccharide biosynthesis/export family protein [Bacteroidetes bacterium]|nr:polysaccharide biosynthesis/export family protein [Bacteroidota bacterium]
MFKEDKKPVAVIDSVALPPIVIPEYKIRTGDEITMRVYSNNGYNIIAVLTSAGSQSREQQYIVRSNGYIKLPIIDSINILGLSISQAENAIEEAYFPYFNDPFVLLSTVNKQVSVFFGNSSASIVSLDRENVTLLEVLAKAGGLSNRSKAHRIKILRGDMRNPQIIHIDLSTIEGLRKADLNIRADDIIYVDPALRITSDVLREITPIIGILTSFLLVIDIILTRTNTP